MKKTITITALLLLGYAGQAQMKVGTPAGAADASSILDISNTGGGTKGFLAPQVVLTATNVAAPVTAPANGLIIFNTATAGAGATAVAPGYYYWNSTLALWVTFNTSASALTTGNIYTNDGTLTGARTVTMAGNTLNFTTSGTGNALTLLSPALTASVVGWQLGKASSTNNSLEIRYKHVADGDFTNRMELGLYNQGPLFNVLANGNIGIGTVAPVAKLDVNGTARIAALPAGLITDKVVTVDGSGNLRSLASPLFNDVVKGQLVIPTSPTAFTGHSTTAFDTPDFYCVSFAYTTFSANVPASAIAVYEFTGAPLASLTSAYSFVNAFNPSSYPDTFVGNTQGLTNNASGNVGSGTRTQIKIKWVRVDNIGAAWGANFAGSVMVVR